MNQSAQTQWISEYVGVTYMSTCKGLMVGSQVEKERSGGYERKWMKGRRIRGD